jgi:hypothetical protein
MSLHVPANQRNVSRLPAVSQGDERRVRQAIDHIFTTNADCNDLFALGLRRFPRHLTDSDRSELLQFLFDLCRTMRSCPKFRVTVQHILSLINRRM